MLVGPCTPVFGLKGGVWVGSVSVIPIFPADVGYVRQSQQERDCGVEDGQVGESSMVGVVKKRVVMWHHIRHPLIELSANEHKCDTLMCPTSSHLRHCVEDEPHPLLGSVMPLVYPRIQAKPKAVKVGLAWPGFGLSRGLVREKHIIFRLHHHYLRRDQ